jgi:hypothetical protein
MNSKARKCRLRFRLPKHNLLIHFILGPTSKIFVALFLMCNWLQGMSQIDISIKAGAAKLLRAPRSSREGYAYVTEPPFWPYPALYLEASKKNFLKKTNLVFGIGMLPAFSVTSANPNNIALSSGRGMAVIVYPLQFHVGLEKIFRQSDRPSRKNNFSLIGAIGLNLTGKIRDTFYFGDGGYTNNNEVFEGTKYYFQNTKFFAPAVIAGGGYHINNRKGNEVLSLQLLFNYNLVQYYDHSLAYTINGKPMVDLIPEKGFSVQLLFVKRLFSF